ncbi:MAG: hypothetical protein H3C47_16105 [Candidatus Cloacimonetes bacterium]|nr:hypothetical protein [Candidatus Cloacimonadota bacterium]
MKLDIKDCYESIPLAGLIRKYEDDMILAPQCLNLLKQIQCNLEQENIFGLPRGLSISPTLSELYLEGLDKIIASHPDILYSARYVDDIIIHCPKYKSNNVKDFVIEEMKKLELKHNTDSKKYYLNDTESAEFDYLGYAIRARILQKKGQRVANEVQLSIAKSKLDKIKSKIMVSLCEYKGDGDFSLLKRRLQYLSMLKEAKGGVNGDLLAGIAYNYQYVTDEFACLKPLDGFLHTQIRNSRFGLLVEQISELSRLSFYGIARKRNIGNFSRKKVLKITQAWRNV